MKYSPQESTLIGEEPVLLLCSLLSRSRDSPSPCWPSKGRFACQTLKPFREIVRFILLLILMLPSRDGPFASTTDHEMSRNRNDNGALRYLFWNHGSPLAKYVAQDGYD